MLLGLPRTGDDDGFTLPEILIAMFIIGLLITAMGGALIVGFRTTDDTQTRLSESHDAEIASAYLANDVQSARSITSSSCPGSPGSLINFAFDRPTPGVSVPGGTTGVASYYYGVSSSGETQVTRRFCTTGGAQLGYDVIAHFPGSGAPVVKCDGGACTAGMQPDKVSMSFTEKSGYTFSLLGTRRMSTGTALDGTPIAPDFSLLAWGSSPVWVSGSCPKGLIDNPGNPNNQCTSDTETGSVTNPKLSVLGNLYVNSTLAGAVRLSGMKNQTKLSITNDGKFGILSPGACTGCTAKTVDCATCTGGQPGSYSPAYPDPLRFMTTPVETGMPVHGGTYAGPGVYTSTLSITGDTTLAPGVYVLNNGINVTGNATVNGNGVTLYNKGGNINFGGTTTINLTAPTTGQYAGIVIFQCGGTPGTRPATCPNTNNVSLNGSTGIMPIGIIYAPQAANVVLGIGGANLHVRAVIAQNIKVSGNSQVTVGG
jgi:prepilin-type N-terminal cleavage/methylation domain-containing protein